MVWNERQGCEIDLPRIDLSAFDEVFAIDGGSTDGTAEVLSQFGILVHQQQKRGLNAAYWEAVETSRCDHLVVFFPKGTLSPEILSEFRRQLFLGNDLVIASRMKKGARNEEDAHFLKPRKWGVACLAIVAALLWRREGELVWDVLHGVKGFSREAFLKMDPSRTGLSIDIEMVVRSYRLRLRRKEFPVVETARSYGETRFKILPTGIKLAKYLWREWQRPAKVMPSVGLPSEATASAEIAVPDSPATR